MTESTPYAPTPEPPVAAPAAVPPARGRYRTPTIVVLVLTVVAMVSFLLVGQSDFQDYTAALYALLFLVVVTCFVVSIVLRVRTKRAGQPTTLATITVVVTSLAIALIILGFIFLIGAFILLLFAFASG